MAEVATEVMENCILGLESGPIDEVDSLLEVKEEIKEELFLDDADTMLNFVQPNLQQVEDVKIENTQLDESSNSYSMNKDTHLIQVTSSLQGQNGVNISKQKKSGFHKTVDSKSNASGKFLESSKNKEKRKKFFEYLKNNSKIFKSEANNKICNELGDMKCIPFISNKHEHILRYKKLGQTRPLKDEEKYIGINKFPCKESVRKKIGLNFCMLVNLKEKQLNCKAPNQVNMLNTSPLVYNNVRERFACNICKKSFVIKSSFDDHMRSHHMKSVFTCNLCANSFREKTTLNRHMNLHYERPFGCDLCEKSFKELNLLETHAEFHTAGSICKCPTCNTFSAVKSLSNGMALNSGKELYKCRKCNKYVKEPVFKNPSGNNSKLSFICNICKLSFNKKVDLCAHVLSTYFKEFPCNTCYQSFEVKGDLDQHVLETHGRKLLSSGYVFPPISQMGKLNKVFTCAICQNYFSQIRFLRNHERRKHGIE